MPRAGKKARSPAAAASNSQPQKTRLWLMFPPKLITIPVVWQLGQKFKVVTNVRQASVTDEIGVVCLELEGQRAEMGDLDHDVHHRERRDRTEDRHDPEPGRPRRRGLRRCRRFG